MKLLPVLAAVGVQVVASVAAVQPASAQPVRAETTHVSVTTSTTDATVTAGRRVTLVFDVAPKRGMHVYAPGKHDYQVIGVSLDPQVWMRSEPVKYPPSELYDFPEPLNERVEVYSKPFTLRQDLSILDTPAARKQLATTGSLLVTGLLTYQACDDRVCYSPTKIPLKFVFKAGAATSGKLVD